MTIERFGIGLPRRARKLKAALNSLGEDKLVESGMLIRPEEGKKDSLRPLPRPDYVPGPRCTRTGHRLRRPDPWHRRAQIPKLPDTLDKGRTLYNIDRAGPASRQARRLIVVEGYMDVIALDRAGIAEAVAPNGTAVTEAQLERMWRLDGQPICCFDGDAPGRRRRSGPDYALPHPHRAHPALRRPPLRPGPRRPGPNRRPEAVEAPAGQPRATGRAALAPRSRSLAPRHARGPRGLKQRLIEHTQAIADPSVRQLYRDEWLRRFDALVRPSSRAFALALPAARVEETKGRLAHPKKSASCSRQLPRPAPVESGRRRHDRWPRPCSGASSSTLRRCTIMSRSWPTSASPTRAAPRYATSWCRLRCPASILIVTACRPYWRTGRRARMSGAVRCGFLSLGKAAIRSRLSDLGDAFGGGHRPRRDRGGAEGGNRRLEQDLAIRPMPSSSG